MDLHTVIYEMISFLYFTQRFVLCLVSDGHNFVLSDLRIVQLQPERRGDDVEQTDAGADVQGHRVARLQHGQLLVHHRPAALRRRHLGRVDGDVCV